MGIENYLDMGGKIYDVLLSHEDTQFIICPCSIGDTVNVVAFLSAYKRTYSYDKVFVVVKNAQTDFLNMFPGIDGVLAIDDVKMFALRVYVAVNEKYHDKNVLYGHFAPHDLSFASFKTTQELSFVNEYKASILGIPLNSQMDEIRLPETYAEVGENSVLILPYAKTFAMIDNLFWEMLIQKYNEKGKKVFCNVGPNESCIGNSIPCQVSVSELCSLAFSFEQIIGLRSGIMDLLGAIGCTMDVLYTGILSNVYDSCKLEGIRLYTDISELTAKATVRNYAYVKGNEELLINELLQQI